MTSPADALAFASSGSVLPFVARPPVAGAPGESEKRVLCIPVLRRAGGFLLALPAGAVPPTLLAQGNAGDPDAMFGPSTLLTVPAMEEQEDGAEVATETSIEVLIVDFSDAAASFLEPFDPLSLEDPVPFSEEAPQVFPECRQLVALSKSWVRTAEGERIAFYSAQEGEEEAPGLVDPVEAPAATAKAKAKRVTTAQLAEQLGSISQLLPTISDRLQDLAERQKELETKVTVQTSASPVLPGPAHKQPFTLPTSKAAPAVSNPTQALVSVLGPPPRSRPLPSAAALGDAVPQPPQLEEDLPPDTSTAHALAQQTAALTQLVSHLIQASDGSGDFVGAPAPSGLSSRASAKRGRAGPADGKLYAGSGPERLQAKLPYRGDAPDVGRFPTRASTLPFQPLPGASWRVPASAGPGPHHAYGHSGGRPPHGRGGGGQPGLTGPHHGVPRTGGRRPREIRGGIHTFAVCRTAPPDLHEPGVTPQPATPGLRTTVPRILGDDGPCIFEGDRRDFITTPGGIRSSQLFRASTRRGDAGGEEAAPKTTVPEEAEGDLEKGGPGPGVAPQQLRLCLDPSLGPFGLGPVPSSGCRVQPPPEQKIVPPGCPPDLGPFGLGPVSPSGCPEWPSPEQQAELPGFPPYLGPFGLGPVLPSGCPVWSPHLCHSSSQFLERPGQGATVSPAPLCPYPDIGPSGLEPVPPSGCPVRPPPGLVQAPPNSPREVVASGRPRAISLAKLLAPISREHSVGRDGQGKARTPAHEACPRLPDHGRATQAAQPPRLSFRSWSLSFAFRVVRTRTPFGAFLGSLLHLSAAPFEAPSKTLFPLPLPFFGLFNGTTPQPRSSAARSKLGVRRVLFVTVAALNYLHAGSQPVRQLSLRRPPNATQAKALDYLGRLVKASGGPEDGKPFSVSLPSASRRSSQLIARLEELSEQLTWSGSSFDKYGRAFPGAPLHPDAARDALNPYRSLDPSRLVLAGRANWDPSEFLDDLFYLPSREPQSILLPKVPPPMPGEVPDLTREDPAAVRDLCQVWDSRGLLRLSKSGPAGPHQGVRIFNAVKSAVTDRQIGDRRGRNRCEGVLAGPSGSLPSGPLLNGLFVDVRDHRLSIAVTDRRDFYHQLAVPPRRALRNVLVPSIEASQLRKLKAFSEIALLEDSPSGTCLGGPLPAKLYPAFGAVLQGDALGVEFATSAHSNLLRSFGLLSEEVRLQSNAPFPLGGQEDCLQALVIDDFFAVSAPRASASGPSAASLALARAQAAYSAHSILGSPEKDIDGASRATVAGAELDSSPYTRSLGLALVGPPRAKRVALAAITLEAARLTHTTDVLHLCLVGGWVSGFMYRRPFMSAFSRVFSFVDSASVVPESPRVLPLHRRVADELVLAASLAHVLVSDISAPWASEIYATDSSDSKGAIVSAPALEVLPKSRWVREASVKGGGRS